MAKFPKIQRSCPVKDSLAQYMDGDVCSLCSRQVFDLNTMSESERLSFMQSCTEEVCVSYKIPLRSMAAAAALSAVAIAMPSNAQETLVDVGESQRETLVDWSGNQNLPQCADELELIEIFVGGIKDTSNVEYIDTEEDLETPELPVTYEDA